MGSRKVDQSILQEHSKCTKLESAVKSPRTTRPRLARPLCDNMTPCNALIDCTRSMQAQAMDGTKWAHHDLRFIDETAAVMPCFPCTSEAPARLRASLAEVLHPFLAAILGSQRWPVLRHGIAPACQGRQLPGLRQRAWRRLLSFVFRNPALTAGTFHGLQRGDVQAIAFLMLNSCGLKQPLRAGPSEATVHGLAHLVRGLATWTGSGVDRVGVRGAEKDRHCGRSIAPRGLMQGKKSGS